MITDDDIPLDKDEYEFSWELVTVYNVTKQGHQRRGADVKYTPKGNIEGCSEITQFVPIPWHKCRDAEHAREVMGQKIRSRAPRSKWEKELQPAEEKIDHSNEFIGDIANGEPERGESQHYGKSTDDHASGSEVANNISQEADELGG